MTRGAEAAGISRRTAHKWLSRFESQNHASLQDRSSRPRRQPNATPIEWREMILLLRRTKMTGPQIARDLKRPRATVARVLKRAGLERLKNLEPREPENRYQHRRPGDLLHLDIKKLGRISGFHGHRITGDRSKSRRGAGWDYVHVAIDDRSRIAYAEVLRDETAESSAAFLRRAVAWYRTLGIRIRKILTDNGTGYIARRFAHEMERLRFGLWRARKVETISSKVSCFWLGNVSSTAGAERPSPSNRARMVLVPPMSPARIMGGDRIRPPTLVNAGPVVRRAGPGPPRSSRPSRRPGS